MKLFSDFVKSTSHDYPTNSNRIVSKIVQRLHRSNYLFIFVYILTGTNSATRSHDSCNGRKAVKTDATKSTVGTGGNAR